MSERLCTGLVKRGKYWHLRYRLPGEFKERRKSLSVRDKRVAETKKAQFEEDFERGQAGLPSLNRPVGSEPGLIDPLLNECLEHRRNRGTGEKQLGHVRRDVEMVCEALGWASLRSINAREYQNWQTLLGARVSARTKNNRLNNFRSFIQQLVRMNLLQDDPLAVVPLIDERAASVRGRRALTDDEVRRLLSVASPDRRLIYLTVVHAGLRRGDLEALRWRDLVLTGERPFIQLWEGNTKGKRDEQVAMHPELRDAFVAYRAEVVARDEDRVFRKRPIQSICSSVNSG